MASLDFVMISTRTNRNGDVLVYPKFIVKKSKDLMIQGNKFYAIWIDEIGRWSKDEDDAIRLIDAMSDEYAEQYKTRFNGNIIVLHLWDAETEMIDKWHKFCQKQMQDCYHMLDDKLIFANDSFEKKDYASKRLSYPLEKGDCPAWDRIVSTLYSPEEQHKIEWAIGSIVTGESKHLQKFLVFYGAAGTGKSTILNVIQQLFDGYYCVFDAKALGSNSAAFALEPFRDNPLVAIQHDGDLSRIEDNTRLNSLVSHEKMTVNEKYKNSYTNYFKAFLFMGTNKPVKITDAKSGLLRRLIDVSPSGNKLEMKDYKKLTKQISFELGAIASKCRDIYLDDPSYYDSYIPLSMMSISNDFYNYVLDSYSVFVLEDGITLKRAYDMYKEYCEEANVPHPLSRMIFKEELKNYFESYDERTYDNNGARVRCYYSNFRREKLNSKEEKKPEGKSVKTLPKFLIFKEQKSLFDEYCKECPAQYGNDEDKPMMAWDKVTDLLSGIDTLRLHYVRVPENHIVIDFDIPDENGNKCLEKNLEAASKWPETYAELSKSGQGIHLHYIYTGDPSKLSRLYAEHIEVKVFTGKSSLRRKLTKCNDIPIATISSGLPLKGEKVVNFDTVKSEKGLRALIARNLNKEIHSGTKPSIDFIKKILDDAYDSGLQYDISDMKNVITAFASKSTNHADYCIKQVLQMKFKSDDISNVRDLARNTLVEPPIVFYDIEVFPNLFLVNWKYAGLGKNVVRMINPSPGEIEFLMRNRLIGFNCRRYDNHILYARMMGYTEEQLYLLSQKIINNEKDCYFGEAYNVSYTDVYDFASAGNKKSLKKLEIEMNRVSVEKLKKDGFSDEEIALIKAGRHHKELGLPWDKPVPENLWPKVAEYCDNDVIATEAAFTYLKSDFTAREILAEIAGMTVNDTTNTLTTRVIFGNNRKPQSEFHYRDLSKPVMQMDDESIKFLVQACPEMMAKRHGKANSLLPYWEGYTFDHGVSTYKGIEVGEGGRVEAMEGMHGNVALLDIASMHPHSTIAEILFGVRYTIAYREIVEGRVSIKHKAWDEVNDILGGALTKFIQRVKDGLITAKALANALKTAINSVYGLTSAKFDNPFRDRRNIDNIVAKRGALFMIDLAEEVKKRGFRVAHVKTDSIKIPDATPEIIDFVYNYGKEHGYTFEHEATYDRMCLVNDAVYIARYKDTGEWTATGKQFAVPYVFKALFSHEDIEFNDMCETFAVSKGDLYLDMNEGLPDVTLEEKELEKLEKRFKDGKVEEAEYTKQKEQLSNDISKGHNYVFVGRVGQFTPIKDGCGGGVLYRVQDGKYYAAAGTTGYRWLESETVLEQHKEKDIDERFYLKQVDDAIDIISQHCDFNWFVSDDPYPVPVYEQKENECLGFKHPNYELLRIA